jgi:hypothetical protein
VVEGRDIEPWPGLKWSRALEHFAILDARVAQWNATRQFEAGLRVTDDRTCLELLQLDGPRPPVAEWGLVFGDGIHNLRAALDCLVWEFAHLDGGSPGDPRQVSFPVINEQCNWPDAARRLASVPTELLKRIEQVQPFRSGGGPQPHPLAVLSRLDNDDKHRRVISAIPGPVAVTMSDMNLQMGAPIEGGQVFFDTLLNLDEASTGDPFARLCFGIYIEPASRLPDSAIVEVAPGVLVGDRVVATTEAVGVLLSHVGPVLRFLLTGQQLDEQPDQLTDTR